MELTSSLYSNIEPYKPCSNTSPNGINYNVSQTSANGINPSSAGYTVFKSSGINRKNQPYSSGIYTVTIEAPKKDQEILPIEKEEIQHLQLEPSGYPTFRRYRRLHIHRMDALVELNNIDKDIVIRDLLKLLNYENIKEKHTSGEAFTTLVCREKRGESITISLNHKTNTYTIRITTHRLQRLKLFLDYAYTVLKIDKIRTLMIETYIRYLERYELKIAKTLEALDVELGKGIKQHLIPNRGKHDYYLSRAKIEYRGATIVLKTYRHATYRQHKPTHPEYHPKLEQLTILKNQPTTLNIESVIREYSTLLYTIAWTINPRLVLGEYEINETETIEVSSLDKTIQRYIRGITKRIKAEVILEEQYPDKRIAIAKLLVEKKMKPMEIAKTLGYTKQMIHYIINQLIEQGIIKRVKRGVYEWSNKNAKLEKQRIVESRQMTLQQLIEFTRETKARVIQDKYTPVLEVEDEYTIKRIIISNIIIEEDRIIEKLAGRKLIYTIPREKILKR
jgi:predicted transcriptional regulator